MVAKGFALPTLSAVAGALLTFLPPAGARAESGQHAGQFSLAYRAAPDCPSEASFEAAVRSRVPWAERAPLGLARLHFDVQLRATGLGQKSRFVVVRPDGAKSERVVPEESCADAMESMAVIAAMTLDAERKAGPSTSDFPSDAPAPGTPSASRAPTSAPVAASARELQRSAGRDQSLGIALGLGGVMESAAAPHPVLGLSLGLEVSSPSSSLWAIRARLGGLFAESDTVSAQSGEARFRLLSARAQLCTFELASGVWGLRACAVLDAGYLRGRGYRVPNERTQIMPWLAAGLAVSSTLMTTRSLALTFEAGARRLIVHDRFTFNPREVVHQVPAIAWNLGLGGQWAFR